MSNSVTLRQNVRRRHGRAQTMDPSVKISLGGRKAKRNERRSEACGAAMRAKGGSRVNFQTDG